MTDDEAMREIIIAATMAMQQCSRDEAERLLLSGEIRGYDLTPEHQQAMAERYGEAPRD